MRVVLIDSGGANIGSVLYALERLGVDAVLSADAGTILGADKVILPGVGAAGAAMARLRAHGLVEVVRSLSQPLLGICLGMQLLYESSEEGDVQCLGRIAGRVRRMEGGEGLRIPHMGWNTLDIVAASPLLEGVATGQNAYFVHGFAAPVGADSLATSTHGQPFTAVVGRGRCFGAQFHPERSADVGARILENFIALEAT
ncbi:imidazole glycerol phosphate synthase subunit HisH [Marilutibacter spongiae]|uniref:Imidazole glycerol phosphate synthase subunit HisH n=1 Tax=Marilutibacter spongiae TaxID=2025720 RepID=A0A7W3Y634_9GAMM|nr:imidazole glycerol phosphate synthase subunit HisH [Lysobacter spongiae]MBB1060541.1 imidazole glycerol phosphate synthase subunit HisH [Lysobacter spongiae]